ncbi:MAG: FAD:protein FMN transferase [Lachnospiraceae bacterium]|nr:FAD:protein FMN transferase [Lachnospiraceae bacterium]
MRFLARNRKIINILVFICCVILFVYFAYLTITSSDSKVENKTYPGTAMGTSVKKNIYADDLLTCDEIDAMIDDTLKELENEISLRVSGSTVQNLNNNYVVDGTNQLPEELLSYLKFQMQICKESNGAFSPCIRPIAALWGIEEGFDVVPTEEEIETVLGRCAVSNLEILEDGVVFHDSGMQIDFGASGKGIACDLIKEKLQASNVRGAVVSIGGSVLTYGDKGNSKGWHIAIQDPRGEQGAMLGIVDVDGEVMVSTSGDYEKYFEIDGKRYHHIFDPRTGYPVDNGLISVTIVSDNGMLSDVMSTACFVMGLEDGMEYANQKGVEAIFVTDQKEVYITKGLKKTFRLQSDDYKIVK